MTNFTVVPARFDFGINYDDERLITTTEYDDIEFTDDFNVDEAGLHYLSNANVDFTDDFDVDEARLHALTVAKFGCDKGRFRRSFL